MGLIKREHAERVTTGAVVLQLGDLGRHVEEVRSASRDEAEKIIAAAKAERERTMAGAHEQGHKAGYDAGYAEGLKAGQAKGHAEAAELRGAELDQIIRAWTVGVHVFTDARATSARSAADDVLRLAVLFAEKVAKRAVAVDPGSTALAQLRDMIGMMLEPSRITISVHAEDADAIRTAMPELASMLCGAGEVILVEDASLERGSCVLSTPTQAEIDGRVQVMLDRLASAILPAGRVRDVEDQSEGVSTDVVAAKNAADNKSSTGDGIGLSGERAA